MVVASWKSSRDSGLPTPRACVAGLAGHALQDCNEPRTLAKRKREANRGEQARSYQGTVATSPDMASDALRGCQPLVRRVARAQRACRGRLQRDELWPLVYDSLSHTLLTCAPSMLLCAAHRQRGRPDQPFPSALRPEAPANRLTRLASQTRSNTALLGKPPNLEPHCVREETALHRKRTTHPNTDCKHC